MKFSVKTSGCQPTLWPQWLHDTMDTAEPRNPALTRLWRPSGPTPSFYSWEDRGPQKSNDLAKVSQLPGSKALRPLAPELGLLMTCSPPPACLLLLPELQPLLQGRRPGAQTPTNIQSPPIQPPGAWEIKPLTFICLMV